MFLLDRMLVGSIRFVLDKLIAAADEELNDEDGLKQRLVEAQMRLELGEIDDEAFAAIEADVLAALRAIGERRDAASGREGGLRLGDGVDVVGASAEIDGDFHEGDVLATVPPGSVAAGTFEAAASQARASTPARAKPARTKPARTKPARPPASGRISHTAKRQKTRR